MNKYKKLTVNTFILGIGSFSSKLLAFFLIPFYTHALTPHEFGIADIIVLTSNLLFPLVSLGVSNAALRFALDEKQEKKTIFSACVIICALGYIASFALFPLVSFVPSIGGYTLLVFLFVLTSAFRNIISNFTRGLQKVKLYAVDGVITTAMTIGLTLYFLYVLKLGILGYCLAIIISDFLSINFLFWVGKLFKLLTFKIKWPDVRPLLKYSVPLIPTMIFWWITNVSDRYMISGFIGSSANGLYATAQKFPTVVVILSNIFIDAWHISAVTSNPEERKAFFKNVFNTYSSLLLVIASFIILFSKIFMKVFAANAYFTAWEYIPFLTLAMVFQCFLSFFGTIYVVEKKSMNAMWTLLIGAVVNIILCWFLIPRIGANGAGIGTAISYLLVFVIRVIDTKKFINFKFDKITLTLNSTLLLCQSLAMIAGYSLYYVIPFTLLILLINFQSSKRQIFLIIEKLGKKEVKA